MFSLQSRKILTNIQHVKEKQKKYKLSITTPNPPFIFLAYQKKVREKNLRDFVVKRLEK